MPQPQPQPLTHLTDDEQALQAGVRDFALEWLVPRRREMDETQHLDPALLEALFGMDLMGLEVPEAYGGLGGSFFDAILVIEALSREDPSVGVLVDVQNTLVNNALLRWGTEAQKATFLPRLCRSEVGAYALSESGSGSDAFSLKARATRAEGGWVLTGSKLWITNAGEASVFIVFATVDPALGHKGITAFLVERGMAGFTVARKEDKLGIRASSTCELVLDGVFVPEDHVLGEVGKGYKVAIETLDEGRIGIAAQMVGLAEGAHAHALAYARARHQFGQPIFEFQAVRMKLAELAIDIEAARLMTYNAARLKDAGAPFVQQAAMAKYFASQVAEKVASQGLEIFGGCGFTKDYPAEKFYRDAKVGKIYEGTSFMQLLTIAKAL